MAIVQISRIQNRRGNLVDLPNYLNSGEFGWALDARRLFIGNRLADGAPADENVEIQVLSVFSQFSEVLASGAGTLVGDILVPTGSFNDAAIFINYSIDDGTNYRIGNLRIITDGTSTALDDDFVEVGTLAGIVFAASISAGVISITYIGASTETMRYSITKWNV